MTVLGPVQLIVSLKEAHAFLSIIERVAGSEAAAGVVFTDDERQHYLALKKAYEEAAATQRMIYRAMALPVPEFE